MDEHYTTELLVRYLDGELDNDERVALEQRLAAEPSLKQELDTLELAMHAVSLSASEEKVKRIHRQMVTERHEPKTKVVPLFSRLPVRMAAAAVLVLVAGFGWWVTNTGADQIREDHFVAYTVSTSRGTAGAGTIEEMFDRKEYGSIIKYSEGNKINGKDSLLVALSFLELDQYGKAVDWLTALQDEKELRADADYYLGFAYLGMGDRSLALKVFESIKADPTHLYHHMISDGMLRKIRFRSW
jgi:tetratricopeptide (TPR) repeat protein